MRNDTKKELLRYREERKEREKHETALKEEIKKCKEHLRRMYEELGDMNKDEGKQVTSEEFEHHETNKGDQQSAEETRTENDEEISTEKGRRDDETPQHEDTMGIEKVGTGNMKKSRNARKDSVVQHS